MNVSNELEVYLRKFQQIEIAIHKALDRIQTSAKSGHQNKGSNIETGGDLLSTRETELSQDQETLTQSDQGMAAWKDQQIALLKQEKEDMENKMENRNKQVQLKIDELQDKMQKLAQNNISLEKQNIHLQETLQIERDMIRSKCGTDIGINVEEKDINTDPYLKQDEAVQPPDTQTEIQTSNTQAKRQSCLKAAGGVLYQGMHQDANRQRNHKQNKAQMSKTCYNIKGTQSTLNKKYFPGKNSSKSQYEKEMEKVECQIQALNKKVPVAKVNQRPQQTHTHQDTKQKQTQQNNETKERFDLQQQQELNEAQKAQIEVLIVQNEQYKTSILQTEQALEDATQKRLQEQQLLISSFTPLQKWYLQDQHTAQIIDEIKQRFHCPEHLATCIAQIKNIHQQIEQLYSDNQFLIEEMQKSQRQKGGSTESWNKEGWKEGEMSLRVLGDRKVKMEKMAREWSQARETLLKQLGSDPARSQLLGEVK